MTILDILYGLIFQPQGTMRELARTRPLMPAFLIFLGVYGANLLLQEASRSVTQAGLGMLPAYLTWLLGSLGALASIVIWFVSAGIFSLLAELIYGYGNGKGVLACLGFAAFPGIFGPALYYASALLNMETLGLLLYALTMLWVIGLQLVAVREAFTLSTGQAVLIYFLPVALTLVIMILLLIIGGMALSSLPLP